VAGSAGSDSSLHAGFSGVATSLQRSFRVKAPIVVRTFPGATSARPGVRTHGHGGSASAPGPCTSRLTSPASSSIRHDRAFVAHGVLR
jgi:hypothetical protein